MLFCGNLTSLDVYEIIKEMFLFIMNYEGDIPGAMRYRAELSGYELKYGKYEAAKFYNRSSFKYKR